MNEEARGVVVAHGTMARGLIDAVQRIAGASAGDLVAVSNDDCNPPELRRIVDEAAGAGPTVVFVDMYAGSCAMAAFSSCRGSDRRAVVCGVNLPILLDFAFHRDMPFDELVPRLVAKGRDAVRALGRDL